MLKSDDGVMVVVTDELLFSLLVSALSERAVAVFVIETTFPIFAVRVNWAVAAAASSAKLQLTRPFSPTAGVVQLLAAGPLFCTSETKVVPPGS
jgi:hypothetical protein